MDPQGDVVEIIADYGLGVLGVVRLLFTFLYCFILTLLPLIAGWVVAYRLWIHKWSWVREILWRDPTHNRVDSRTRGTYLARRQPSLASVAAAASSSSSSKKTHHQQVQQQQAQKTHTL